MNAALTARSVSEHWLQMLVAAISLGAILVMAMAAYTQIDLSLYQSMPEALRTTMGIIPGADGAFLAYSVMVSTMASLTFGGVAIAMGSAAIAGIEQRGILGLLLSNPMSRAAVLTSRVLALLLLIGGGVALFWGIAELSPVLLGISAGSAHVGAVMLHLAMNTLFYGFLALAIGAAASKAGPASAVTAGMMVLSWLAVGLLPLFSATESMVKYIPWYWFAGSQPLLNGVDWTHIVLLGACVLLFAVVAGVGFVRRDLRAAGSSSLLDRLRANPMAAQLMDRLTAGTRVRSLEVKLLSAHQSLIGIVAAMMFAMMGLMIGAIYPFIADALTSVGDSLPNALLTMVAGGDMSTPEGFFALETLGLMTPIAVILVGTAIAADGIAGEEQANRMGLLLSTTTSRTRIIIATTVAMTAAVSIVSVATGLGIWGGSLIGSLGVDVGNIAGTTVMAFALGLLYSGIALACSAATGRASIAIWATVGLAVAGHFGNAFLAVSDSWRPWARLSPFHYYSSAQPLSNGIDWSEAGVLFAGAAVLIGLSVWLFARRDLRQR